MDVDNIRPGQDFVDAIQSTLDSSSVVLVVIGPRWLDARDDAGNRRLDDEDDLHRIEIEKALSRKPPMVVVPVLVEDARMPKPADLPEPVRVLARRQVLKLEHTTWGRDFDDLRKVLQEEQRKADAESADKERRRQRRAEASQRRSEEARRHKAEQEAAAQAAAERIELERRAKEAEHLERERVEREREAKRTARTEREEQRLEEQRLRGPARAGAEGGCRVLYQSMQLHITRSYSDSVKGYLSFGESRIEIAYRWAHDGSHLILDGQDAPNYVRGESRPVRVGDDDVFIRVVSDGARLTLEAQHRGKHVSKRSH